MKKKTCDLTAEEINFAVAYIENVEVDIDGCTFDEYMNQSCDWNPCFHWSQGGPIIEREKITTVWVENNCLASIKKGKELFGLTALIAAMRCYVASKLGDEVDMQEIFRDLQIEVEVQDESNR